MPLNYMGRVVKQMCQLSQDLVLCLLSGRFHAGPSVKPLIASNCHASPTVPSDTHSERGVETPLSGVAPASRRLRL